MGFHVSQEQTYVLFPLALQSSRHQVDIVLSVDGVRTLIDVVIDNPIRIDLVSWVVFVHGVMTITAIQGMMIFITIGSQRT